MKSVWRKGIEVLMLAGILLAFSGCAAEDPGRPAAEEAADNAEPEEEKPEGAAQVGAAPQEKTRSDIVILYTGNIRGTAEENLGLAKVAALKKEQLKTNSNVTLVDCGNHSRGSRLAAAGQGRPIIEIMNQAGYDFAALGSSDFGYGLEALRTNMMAAEFRYLGSNVTYAGTGADPLFGLEAFEIVEYEGTRVAFIGVAQEKEVIWAGDGELRDMPMGQMDYSAGTPEDLFACVQSAVDECLQQGAEYVIVLSSLEGEDGKGSGELIRNTSGIDAVLEGGISSVIVQESLNNINGEPVLRSSPGERLKNIGELILASDGRIRTRLISSVPEGDPETEQKVRTVSETGERKLKESAAISEFALRIDDSDGVRCVLCRETNMGDLCTDALRVWMGAEIAIKDGASIQAGFPAGEISRGMLLDALPGQAENILIRTSGKHILEALEYGARLTQENHSKNGKAVGESESFLQVSGLKYTIETYVPSGVEQDKNGRFSALGKTVRVTNVQVERDGAWESLDPEAEYTLALPSSMAVSRDSGFTMFQEDEILRVGADDVTVLTRYLEQDLRGVIPKEYEKTQGRIKVK